MMNLEDALKIMGLSRNCNHTEIKKKYRQLMLLTHPDMGEEHDYPYEASEINVAYEFLLQDESAKVGPAKSRSNMPNTQQKSRVRWNAPINPKAWVERPIFHTVEDADGLSIGEAIIDHGRYLWTEEEDFPLFLKSLYVTARKILDEEDHRKGIDRSGDLSILKEMTYQLAKQFVDSNTILALMIKDDKGIYQASAMVELVTKRNLKKGMLLYPSRLQEHRFYVQDEKGKELGHISFRDDRLYYGIIPLFEDRSVQVKMWVEDGICKRANGRYYVDIILYLKLV